MGARKLRADLTPSPEVREARTNHDFGACLGKPSPSERGDGGTGWREREAFGRKGICQDVSNLTTRLGIEGILRTLAFHTEYAWPQDSGLCLTFCHLK